MSKDLSEYAFPRNGHAWCLALVMMLAASWAGYNAWGEQQHRTLPLDLDGWGHRVTLMAEGGRSLGKLFNAPSLWKGPIVPFVFGVCYFVAPFDVSVLLFNVAFFALSAGVLFDAFCRLGENRWAATAAILLWVFYLPHRIIFGYFFAEPLLALLSAVAFWLAVRVTDRPRVVTALALGATAGVLVLAGAPFLLVVIGLPLVLWRPLGEMRARALAFYSAGFLLAFSPWPIRNYVVEHEVIPFTTEGGKILFQGTYLAGDDAGMGELRKQPEFREFEAGEDDKSAAEQYRYWRSLALAQVREAPSAQLALCGKKALRFWVYLPAHSWAPSWKTAVVAILALPLAAVGAWRGRRSTTVRLCVLWVGGLWLFHGLVHAELRYNFPVLPMLFLLACRGAMSLLPADSRFAAPSGATGNAARLPVR